MPILIPATGTGATTPNVDTRDYSGSGGAHRQVMTLNQRTPNGSFNRPANTTAYSAGQLVANSVTAGSVTPTPITVIPAAPGGGAIWRARLYTTELALPSDMQFHVDLWTAAPTFTNGDGGTYAVATGAANWLGSFQIPMTQAADGAYGVAAPDIPPAIRFAIAAGTIVWTLRADVGYTPGSGKSYNLVLEISQD